MGFTFNSLNKKLKIIEKRIQNSFKKVKEELDEHRDSINANTEEIQLNYEYVLKLENKIDALEQKLEQVYLMLSAIGEKLNLSFLSEKKKFKENIWLTNREKVVFDAMLNLCYEQGPITIYDLIKETDLPESMIKESLLSLSNKGVPIIIREVNDNTYYELDQEFILLQKKKEIIK
ncbi:MAG: hypothetical protein PWP03_133 [Candidatus Woesearchaeota archaeon]|nr:hypothetical protein [Candidatus Woesearchaeota archaeon]